MSQRKGDDKDSEDAEDEDLWEVPGELCHDEEQHQEESQP